eukprot:g2359.t1
MPAHIGKPMSLCHVFDDRFVLETSTTDKMLVIDRRPLTRGGKPAPAGVPFENGTAHLEIREVDGAVARLGPAASSRSFSYDCFLGFVSLQRGPYLALATESEFVGHFVGKAEIHLITRVEFIPVAEVVGILPQDRARDEERYLDMLRSVVRTRSLYFSYGCDITHTQQRASGLQAGIPVHQRADRRFCWNQRMCNRLAELQLHRWIMPVTNGYFHVVEGCHANVAGVPLRRFTFIFASRRSCRRQGTRFWRRGLDDAGDVANFVETEQICLFEDGSLTSFVQVRGSIPLSWAQPVCLKYMPRVEFLEAEVAGRAAQARFKRHFDELREYYGRVIAVNLIDMADRPGGAAGGKKKTKKKKGGYKRDQQKLGDAFGKCTEALGDPVSFRYVWFDFHHECRKMKYHNLSKLMAEVGDEFAGGRGGGGGGGGGGSKQRGGSSTAKAAKGLFGGDGLRLQSELSGEYGLPGMGFFHRDAAGQVLRMQQAVFRTNCMDNLDRTNVVQSLFARRSLLEQLGVRADSEELAGSLLESRYADLEVVFKNTWANNADAMSFLYSGTGALKTDFTRTGKRTTRGLLQDARNSMVRYFLNNFTDGSRQDAIDLFLLNFRPEVSPRFFS